MCKTALPHVALEAALKGASTNAAISGIRVRRITGPGLKHFYMLLTNE